MKKFLYSLVLAAACIMPAVTAAQVAPPENTVMADGTRRGTQPSATQCLNAGATAWEPCRNNPVLPTGTSAQQVQGTAANGAADNGNPNKVGGVASTNGQCALVADGARVNACYTRNGAAVIWEADGAPITVTPVSAAGVLFSAQTNGYAGVSYVSNSGWSGSTIAFEGSNDSTDGTNGTWVSVGSQVVNTGIPVTQTQSPGTAFFIPALTSYVRARVSAFSSGPVGGAALLRSYSPFTQANTVNNNKSIWYTEANNVAVAIGANQNGSSRDTGVAGSDYRYANWSCFANPTASSSGALLVAQGSLDNTTWVTTQSAPASTAGQASTTQNGIFFRYNRCMFNNTAGGAATNVYLMGRYSE
jgi:hypothetical protein